MGQNINSKMAFPTVFLFQTSVPGPVLGPDRKEWHFTGLFVGSDLILEFFKENFKIKGGQEKNAPN
jgi:hypothetical protein